MDLIGYSLKKPISVAVGVILVVMFGLVGLDKLPIQLTPDVEEPQISIRTSWFGATPYDIEKEVINKQEEVFKGLKGLKLMESSSYNDYGEISLTFNLGTDLDDALLRVSNKLNEVEDYPDNVKKPSIEGAGAQSSPAIWLLLKMKSGDPSEIRKYRTFFEDDIRQHLERIEGVGSLFVFGGTEKQLEVVIDSEKLARHNITISDVIYKLREANNNISAGVLGIEKKNYRIRTISQFQTVEEPLETVIFDDGVKRVLLKDLASTEAGFEKKVVSVMHNAVDVIVVGVRKEQGANVIRLVEKVRQEVDSLNSSLLADNNLYFHWSYDQAPYILNAIDIVKNNMLIGGILAVIVLLLFMKSVSATITTAFAIPISIIGTFIFLWSFGRNLNVVSLAGLSFAVGMLVDNSIVVLENIDRHRKMGKKAYRAAYDGAKEVYGAVLASTATTVAVFLPVIYIEQEAGQLFRDIAIAITFSIIISLFVSISVIPAAMKQFYMRLKKPTGDEKQGKGVGWFFVTIIMFFSNLFLKNVFTRVLCIVMFTSFSVLLAYVLIPKAEYLPQGNRNLVFSILIPPPGYSVEKREEIGKYIFEKAKPYLEEEIKDGIPQIKDIFFVSADRISLFGAVNSRETEARKMMPLLNRIVNSIPGVFGVSIQAGIFQDRLGRGRTVDVDISGDGIEDIVGAAGMLFGMIRQKIQNVQVRPVPSLEISYPEVNIVPDKKKLAASGLTESDLGIYIDVLMDGRKIDEYRPEGSREIDLVIKGDDNQFRTPEDVLDTIIVNKNGQLIRIGDVVKINYAYGMTQIDHLERKRNIKLEVTPPENLPLQAAMELIENDIIAGLNKAGMLKNVSVTVGGNADKLTETRLALQMNFLMAIAITYLLMAALFENFFYPVIILFSVPLAAAGGFIGLSLVDRFVAPQAFDILTMLGFVILVGTVVNNAILIVHQALNNVRYEGMSGIPAISESVKTRIRPIFMSATTSLFGMLPLVLSTGAGSELYRGLGSVLLGGMALSTVFTLFVIPSFLAFFIGFERKRDDDV